MQGIGKIIATGESLCHNFPSCVLVLNRELASSLPDFDARFGYEIARAADWCIDPRSLSDFVQLLTSEEWALEESDYSRIIIGDSASRSLALRLPLIHYRLPNKSNRLAPQDVVRALRLGAMGPDGEENQPSEALCVHAVRIFGRELMEEAAVL